MIAQSLGGMEIVMRMSLLAGGLVLDNVELERSPTERVKRIPVTDGNR